MLLGIFLFEKSVLVLIKIYLPKRTPFSYGASINFLLMQLTCLLAEKNELIIKFMIFILASMFMLKIN